MIWVKNRMMMKMNYKSKNLKKFMAKKDINKNKEITGNIKKQLIKCLRAFIFKSKLKKRTSHGK